MQCHMELLKRGLITRNPGEGEVLRVEGGRIVAVTGEKGLSATAREHFNEHRRVYFLSGVRHDR